MYTQSAGVLQCGDGIGKTHQDQCRTGGREHLHIVVRHPEIDEVAAKFRRQTVQEMVCRPARGFISAGRRFLAL